MRVCAFYRECAHLQLVRARLCTNLNEIWYICSQDSNWPSHKSFMKIRAFVAEIFAKQYWCFLIIDFQCIFYISAIMHLWSLKKWIITEWLWNFFESWSQNGPISVKWKHQSHFIFCILRLSHKQITFDSSRGTPCSSCLYWMKCEQLKKYKYFFSLLFLIF